MLLGLIASSVKKLREHQNQKQCTKRTEDTVQNWKWKLDEHNIKTVLIAFFKKQTYQR